MQTKTPNDIAVETFRKVYNLPDFSGGEPGEYLGTGRAYHGDVELTDKSSLAGVVLREITWNTDYGNWAWDGAVAALEVMGVDVHAPLPA